MSLRRGKPVHAAAHVLQTMRSQSLRRRSLQRKMLLRTRMNVQLAVSADADNP
jgi:hypothetical protein